MNYTKENNNLIKILQVLYLIFILLFAFASGVYLSKCHYEPTVQELQNQFLLYDQFNPEYINYSHDEMLKLCEKYDLIYDYEKAECT